MRAGALRHPISIEQPGDGGRDPDTNELIPGWKPFASTWAAVEPVSARESDRAQAIAATVSHKITLRFLPGVKPTFRVAFGARTFTVDGVIDVDERGRELNLYCTEVL